VNNPPVGLVTPETDPDAGAKKSYAYDPHLDPQLQWAGKAEHASFEIPTVSLHVHERIDLRTIIEAVRKRNGDDGMCSPRCSTCWRKTRPCARRSSSTSTPTAGPTVWWRATPCW